MLQGGTLTVLGVLLFGLSFFAGTIDASSQVNLDSSVPCKRQNTVSQREKRPVRRHILSPIAKKENTQEPLVKEKSVQFSPLKDVKHSICRKIIVPQIKQRTGEITVTDQNMDYGCESSHGDNLETGPGTLRIKNNPEIDRSFEKITSQSIPRDAVPYVQIILRERLKQNLRFCIQVCNDLLNTMEEVKKHPRSRRYRLVIQNKTLWLSWCIREIASQIIEDDGSILQSLVGSVEYYIFRDFLKKELLPALLVFRDMGFNKTYDDLEYLFDMFGFHDLVVHFRRALLILSPKRHH